VKDSAVFSLDLPHSFDFATPGSGIPKSTSVRSYFSPAHMRASAWLYGVQGAETSQARILDLGCSDASHLLPYALAFPQAQITGIDLSPEKIEEGRQQSALAGIINIHLYCTDLATLINGLEGEFDYIIIHGIFSYVDNETREALLSFCREHLAKNGIIAIEWLTQPGTGLDHVIQDAIAYHTRNAESEEVRLASARAALTWLSLGMSKHPAREALQHQIVAAEAMDDEMFSLRYLQSMSNANYLVEFNESLSNAALHYVGDIQPWTECPEHYVGQVAELNMTVNPDQDKLHIQQYLDFSVYRSSRFSLLSALADGDDIVALPDFARLKDLHWAGSYRRDKNNKGLIFNRLRSASDESISTDDTITLSILDVLGEAWPMSMCFEQIVFNTRAPDEDIIEHEAKVLQSLSALFLQGLTGLHYLREVSVYNTATHSQLTSIFGPAIHQLKGGFNLWHEPVELTLQEQLVLEKESLAFADPQIVDALIRKGVVTGDATSWRKHYQTTICSANLHSMHDSVLPLLLFSASPQQGGYNIPRTKSLLPVHKLAAQNIKPVGQKHIDFLYGLISKGEFEQATSVALKLVEKMPENPNAWMELSRIYILTNQHIKAVSAINRTLGMMPLNWDIYFELVIALWHLEQTWLAGRITKAILRAQPYHALAWDALGRLYTDFNAFPAAEYCYNQALSIIPKNSGLHCNIAVLVADQFRMEEAVMHLRKAIKLKPDELNYYTHLLFGLSHVSSITPKELYEEHRVYGRLVEKWVKNQQVTFTHVANKDPNRNLRIGFVSGDLYSHPVSSFLKPFWTNINRERNELYVYHTSPKYDGVSEYYKSSATCWRDVATASQLELARIIHKDEIDILIDLSGHTGYNRLLTFALKPAPLAISWIGYPGTTGLTAIDYRICGTWMAEPGELDAQFSEKLIYMPMPVQYEPPSESPAINPLPALNSDVFTFGSLNRPKKINDSVIALWAKILVAAPNSRMIIGYMSSEEVSESLRQKLELYGVKPHQLIFRLKTDFAEYLKMHQEIDLLLDTFPYNGGTTSNNAIWMGVPTITISGNTMAGRHGNEILKAFGQEQFLVNSQQEYFEKAVAWMDKKEELNTIRLSMRDRFADMAIHGTASSTAFENLLRTIWQNHCAGKSPVSFTVES